MQETGYLMPFLRAHTPAPSPPHPTTRARGYGSLHVAWLIVIIGALTMALDGHIFSNELGKNENSTTKILRYHQTVTVLPFL